MKNVGPCYKCKCEVWIPDALYEAAQASRGPNGISFYCGYGHGMHFSIGETEADKLRRERDRLAQQIAEKNDTIREERERREATERQLAAQRGVTTKLRKRAAAGTCPCCQRTFSNMANHMKSEHPDYVKDTGANVVQLKRA